MHYYIDGYNLLFRILKGGEDIRQQRGELIHDLEKKIHLLDLDATLVFDSHYQEDDYVRTHYQSLEIVYTAKGESADDYILKELKISKNPAKHIIVTSDKKLANLCRLRLAATETIDEFLSLLNKRYRNKLRNKKTTKTTEVSVPLQPPPKAPVPIPALQETPQNCFDYYLETFEKEFSKIPVPVQIPKLQKETKKPKIKKPSITEEERRLSNFKRWQKAFERMSECDSDSGM